MSLAVEPQRAINPKLPLWNTICGAYATWFNNPLDVLRVSWLWLVLACLVTWVQRSWMVGIFPTAQQGVSQMPIWASALLGIGNLLLPFSIVSIAVAWHRRVILKEQPRLSGSNVFTKSFWRYIGVGILIALAAWLPMLLVLVVSAVLTSVMRAAGHPGLATLILIPLMLALYVTAIAIMLRLMPLLPARAVGDFDRTFKEMWRATRGNTWRLFWGLLASALPLMAIVQIALFSLIGIPNLQMLTDRSFAPRLALINSIGLICYMVIWPIGVSFLSLSYLHFSQRNRAEVFR